MKKPATPILLFTLMDTGEKQGLPILTILTQ